MRRISSVLGGESGTSGMFRCSLDGVPVDDLCSVPDREACCFTFGGGSSGSRYLFNASNLRSDASAGTLPTAAAHFIIFCLLCRGTMETIIVSKGVENEVSPTWEYKDMLEW